MKRLLIIISTFILYATPANATGIKLYIGSAECEESGIMGMYLQLVVCNNLSDTIYIKKDDIDNLYPRVTVDVSEINDMGTFFLLNNVTNIITDQDRLFNFVRGEEPRKMFDASQKQRDFTAKNKVLPLKDVKGIKYYIFAPKQCHTIHCATQSPSVEAWKLDDVTDKQKELVEVYLTTPIFYFTYHDSTPKRELLISRSSEDLKKCIFSNKVKK